MTVFDRRFLPPEGVLELPVPSPDCVVLLGPIDAEAAAEDSQ